MKRILGALCVCGVISMFFTGCNSLITSLEVNPQEVGSSVAATETAGSDGARLNYGEDSLNREIPDYFEQSLGNKFKDLTGKPAFKIKDGHSGKTGDIESFEIEDLLEDGTFIYAYVTRADTNTMPRSIVHCVASYNYRSGRFQVLHENIYRRSWEDSSEKAIKGMEMEEDSESFYVQKSGGTKKDSWRLFVYDNGVGYIYDNKGNINYRTDIESFVRSCFPNVYSVNTYHAMTDGSNKMYMELMVEKEQIDIPENPEADKSAEDEEDAEKEAERVEQEMAEKMESMILVFEFKPIATTMNQTDENFDRQVNAWRGMTQGKEFTKEPDPENDWKEAVKRYPVKWSGAFLPGLSDNYVYAWKDRPEFKYKEKEKYMCTFRPQNKTYQLFKDMKENQSLSNVFVPEENRYKELFGVTGSIEAYDEHTLKRTYTYVWYTTETDAEGNTSQVEHSEEREQTIKRKRGRRTRLSNPYLQGYWPLEHAGINGLAGCVEGRILCTDGRNSFWLMPDGSLQLTSLVLLNDSEIGALRDGDQVYLMRLSSSGMHIEWDRTWGGADSSVLQSADISYSQLAAEYEHKDTVYDNAFMDLNDKLLGESVDVYSNADYYTQDNVLRADLSADEGTALRILELGGEDLRLSSGTSRGFLITSSSKGLIYLDPARKKSVKLDKGSWYRSWKQGNRFISVGFAKDDTAYEGVDVAYARVYEYNLNQLYMDAMEAVLEALEEKVRKEEEKASQSLEGMTQEEEQETVKDMLDEWEEKHKEKWTQVNLETAVSAGENFNTEVFDATMEEKQSMEESSLEQRINDILYGTSSGTTAAE